MTQVKGTATRRTSAALRVTLRAVLQKRNQTVMQQDPGRGTRHLPQPSVSRIRKSLAGTTTVVAAGMRKDATTYTSANTRTTVARGNCRYGAKCHLKHPSSSSDRDGGGGRREKRRSSSGGRGGGGRRDRTRSSSGDQGGGGRERRRSSSGGRGRDRARERSSSRGAQPDFSGPYKWQLEDGHGWKDIANYHILEAQYSQPNNKGINIYNTPYGAVSIDFKAMRVRGKKNLRVRRLDGQQTEWIWFYSTSKGWAKYGEKDAKGNPGPIQSSEIEKKFQHNRNGSLPFNIGSDTFEIRFRQMRQVSGKRKRKVVRRPKYQPPQSGNLIGGVTSAFQRVKMSLAGQSESPEWQFGGKSGRWHTFKDSADIEDQYQQDSNGSMSFTVNGQTYKLDFSAMKQTNQSTRVTRNIRRV